MLSSIVTELDGRSLSSLPFWCVFLFGCVCVSSVAFGVVWLFAVFLQWNRDGSWTMYRSLTSSFLWSTTNGGHLYALISSFTGSMQHATERVERPGESQEALDGKKYLV